MPAESIEIELPEYAEAEEERHTEPRPGRSREVRVHVARVRTDRYRKAEEYAVPSRMSVNLDDEEYDDESYDESYDESDESDRMTPGMIAAIITAASLLVITLVVLGVLLLGRDRSVPADASAAPPAVSETVAAETPAPAPEATPEPPIPTTNPD